MRTLREEVHTYCQTHYLLKSNEPLVVGVSGGADSVCLLAILQEIAPLYHITLHVAHLNHGLRGEAGAEDAAFVANLAKQWDLPYTLKTVDVAAMVADQKLNLEDAARQVRYTFLVAVAREIGASRIAVGHHADDQVETVLLHFLRGAGVGGLRGMRPLTPLNEVLTPLSDNQVMKPPLSLIRPLLDLRRADIEAYCEEKGLNPRTDASNTDITFRRNKIRHTLLPLLRNYNPNLDEALLKLTALMAADDEIIQIALAEAWEQVVEQVDKGVVIYNWSAWFALPLGLQRRVIRRGYETLRGNLQGIEFKHVAAAVDLLRQKKTGATLNLPQRVVLKQHYKIFSLSDQTYQMMSSNLPRIPKTDTIVLKIPGNTPLLYKTWYIQSTLYKRHTISETTYQQTNAWEAYFDAACIGEAPTLRTRQAGDVLDPFGLRGHHQSLKKVLNQAKIPAHQRDDYPLLVSETGQICWVCGVTTTFYSRITPETDLVLHLIFKVAK